MFWQSGFKSAGGLSSQGPFKTGSTIKYYKYFCSVANLAKWFWCYFRHHVLCASLATINPEYSRTIHSWMQGRTWWRHSVRLFSSLNLYQLHLNLGMKRRYMLDITLDITALFRDATSQETSWIQVFLAMFHHNLVFLYIVNEIVGFGMFSGCLSLYVTKNSNLRPTSSILLTAAIHIQPRDR